MSVEVQGDKAQAWGWVGGVVHRGVPSTIACFGDVIVTTTACCRVKSRDVAFNKAQFLRDPPPRPAIQPPPPPSDLPAHNISSVTKVMVPSGDTCQQGSKLCRILWLFKHLFWKGSVCVCACVCVCVCACVCVCVWVQEDKWASAWGLYVVLEDVFVCVTFYHDQSCFSNLTQSNSWQWKWLDNFFW